ncbi:CBM96 family carbohydrate-binding protein [Corallococcus silvisoli]|uniref:CBM96 family carbohydrate-binding protein n=1 Tax=Corallococcus silvisoli TaxID=2697031 RepID=UPI00137886C5|nr:hypothetical protein [Corallococcus silvisoli]NBD08355.1 hypothetical protein [Corallococcus silvisoli]
MRAFGLLSLGILLLGGGAPLIGTAPSVPPECEPETHDWETSSLPEADTYVEEAFPDRIHGRSTVLVSDGNPRQEIYMRFRVADTTGRLGAWLDVPVLDGTSNAPALHLTQPDWDEGTLTWMTRPALLGGPVANVGQAPSGSHIQYDLGQVVTGPGVYSFALIPESTDGMDIRALDARNADTPKLIIPVRQSTCTYRGTGGTLGQPWRYGGAGDEVARAMATDGTGAFVLAGAYGVGGRLGPVGFPGQRGLMLGRFRADGSHDWSRGYAQESAVMTVEDVALTSLGNILVVGSYTGTPNLGTGPLPTAVEATVPAMFIAKFSPNGTPVWAKGFVASLAQGGVTRRVPASAASVATDAQGSLIVTGSFHGAMSLGGGVLDAGPSSRDARNPQPGMFLARFSWEGTHLWSKAFPGLDGGPTQGFRVVTDSVGNVVVGGVASGAGDYDKVLDARVWNTPVIARFSPEGVMQWTRALEFADGRVNGLTLLPGDAVAFSGSFRHSFYFGNEKVYSSRGGGDLSGGIPDAMLGVLESWGADRWARALGDTAREQALRMAADAQSRLVVLGDLAGGSDVGGGYISTGGRGFVASYALGSGAHRWSRALPEGLEPALLGLTPTGAVRVGGSFTGTLRVRQATYTSQGGADVMLLNLSP